MEHDEAHNNVRVEFQEQGQSGVVDGLPEFDQYCEAVCAEFEYVVCLFELGGRGIIFPKSLYYSLLPTLY